jgi:MoaA/NifB/PqqE/SkfB family radical SAM enzyme
MHCAVPKKNISMPYDMYKRIVDVGSRTGLEYLIIGGGEPLLHPDILRMTEYGANAGLKMKLETNGKLLTRSIIDSLKPHLFQLNVSLDGSSKNTHDYIRGSPLFENTIEMIKYARKREIDVAIWAVVMTHNIDELEELIPLAKDVGVNE